VHVSESENVSEENVSEENTANMTDVPLAEELHAGGAEVIGAELEGTASQGKGTQEHQAEEKQAEEVEDNTPSQDQGKKSKRKSKKKADLSVAEALDASEEPLSDDHFLADSLLVDVRLRWYIVSVYAGSEDSARLNLLDRIKRLEHEKFFSKIVVPKVTVDKLLKGGGRKKVEKTSFPGYMFVQMELIDETLATVLGTPRVLGFLGNHKHPKPMSDKDVLHFLGAPKEEDGDLEGEVVCEHAFEKDQVIRVIDGPFANFDGVVDEVKEDQMKLKVLVSILGRETPVELSYDQVEKVEE